MISRLFGFKKNRAVQVSNQRHSSVDKDCNYCPKCGVEYRADIIHCASCQVDLISGAEKLKQVEQAASQKSDRSMRISEVDELVTVIGGKLNNVKSIKNLLAKGYIPSLIVGEGHAKG